MKSAKVSELKARLSAYLSAVREGETVIVCDRRTPIARIVPLEASPDDLRIDEPAAAAAELKNLKGVRLRRKADVVKLLRDDRDQR